MPAARAQAKAPDAGESSVALRRDLSLAESRFETDYALEVKLTCLKTPCLPDGSAVSNTREWLTGGNSLARAIPEVRLDDPCWP